MVSSSLLQYAVLTWDRGHLRRSPSMLAELRLVPHSMLPVGDTTLFPAAITPIPHLPETGPPFLPCFPQPIEFHSPLLGADRPTPILGQTKKDTIDLVVQRGRGDRSSLAGAWSERSN